MLDTHIKFDRFIQAQLMKAAHLPYISVNVLSADVSHNSILIITPNSAHYDSKNYSKSP